MFILTRKTNQTTLIQIVNNYYLFPSSILSKLFLNVDLITL